MVTQQFITLAEQNGYHVLSKPEGYSQLHTDFLVEHPDGTTLEGYSDFYAVQIDYEYGLLTAGMQFDVDVTNSPFYPNQFDYVWDVQPPSGQAGTLLFDPATWFVITMLCVVVIIGFITATIAYSEYIIHPCQPNVEKLSDCMKLVTEPNCSQTYVDICYDGDGDGVREGRIVKTDSDWTGILKWVAIAAVTIGVVYVAAKVVPGLLRRKEPSSDAS